MKLHPEEVNIVCRFLVHTHRQVDLHIQAFHAMACLGTAGRESMDQQDFTEIIVNSLEAHEDNVELVSAALHAIGALANSGTLPKNN